MYKGKKAQVTLFVIIAIVLVAMISMLFYLRQSPKEAVELPGQVSSVKEKIQGCVEDSALESLAVIGLQGGYFRTPAPRLDAGNNVRIAYWYYDGKIIQPSLDTIKNQINIYIAENIGDCVDFEGYSDLQIRKGAVKSTAEIYEDSVKFNVYWPVTVKKGDTSYRLAEPYITSIPFRLRKIHSYATELVNKEAGNPDYIPVSDILDMDMNVTVVQYDSETIIYSIHDIKPEAEFKNYTYTFLFANKI